MFVLFPFNYLAGIKSECLVPHSIEFKTLIAQRSSALINPIDYP